MPIPEAEDTDSDDWQVLHWGSDGRIDNCVINVCDNIDDDEILEYTFATAWGAPVGIYLTLVDRFPDLDISWFYDEFGMQDAGYLTPKFAREATDCMRLQFAAFRAAFVREPPKPQDARQSVQ